MNEGYERPRVDLDTIEELNYISTIEEDAVIDAHIEELREWGYGSISHIHDLQQLFWDFTRRGIILDKLFRVAVVECIEEETLYTKFLGMAKHYNGWAQKHLCEEGKANKELKKTIAEKDSVITKVRQRLRESQENVGKLKNEIKVLQREVSKSDGAKMNDLRHELRKEYNVKVQEKLLKTKPDKLIGKAFMRLLKNTNSRHFRSFDLTKEQDVREYIQWFRIGNRKINMPTQRKITEIYGEDKLSVFYAFVSKYNAEWEATHQGEDGEEETDND